MNGGQDGRKENIKLSCDLGTWLQPVPYYTPQLLKATSKHKQAKITTLCTWAVTWSPPVKHLSNSIFETQQEPDPKVH